MDEGSVSQHEVVWSEFYWSTVKFDVAVSYFIVNLSDVVFY